MFIYHGGVLNLMFECLLNRLLCFWKSAVLSPQLSICSMTSENEDEAFVDAKICTHQYQCPNPFCQRVFASQRVCLCIFTIKTMFFVIPPNVCVRTLKLCFHLIYRNSCLHCRSIPKPPLTIIFLMRMTILRFVVLLANILKQKIPTSRDPIQ